MGVPEHVWPCMLSVTLIVPGSSTTGMTGWSSMQRVTMRVESKAPENLNLP